VLGVDVFGVEGPSPVRTLTIRAPNGPLVLDRAVTGNQVNASKLPVGGLFWRVRAVDSKGNPGAWSDTFQLTVGPAAHRDGRQFPPSRTVPGGAGAVPLVLLQRSGHGLAPIRSIK
jgi:hypothetical protein